MYTQSFSVADSEAKPGLKAVSAPANAEDATLQTQFDAVIDADGKVDPRDWMPDGYRKT
jgi:ring-1,2-phenylacetyl-CoA epoxidase subunit PaaA